MWGFTVIYIWLYIKCVICIGVSIYKFIEWTRNTVSEDSFNSKKQVESSY